MKRFLKRGTTLMLGAILLVGCGGATSALLSVAASYGVFILTTDYATGSYAVVDMDKKTATNNVGSVNGDAAAIAHDGKVYVINRLGADNIQVIDPASGYATASQFSVGSGSNPYDIVFASATSAYVTRYASTEIWIVDPTTGLQTGSIDLSAYADADGIPEMAAAYLSGNALYVALQLLDRTTFSPTSSSLVLVIDISTGLVENVLTLPYTNPIGDFIEMENNRLAIACVGNYGANDGGIAIIDPDASTVAELGMTETILGGDLNAIAMTSATTGFAVINDASYNTSLVSFDAATGTVATIYAPGGFSLAGIAVNGSELWLADRTPTDPGLRIFDTATGLQTTSSPINTGLPPLSIVFP